MCVSWDSQGNEKCNFYFYCFLPWLFDQKWKYNFQGMQNKRPFEIILHVRRVASLQSWVAKTSCHGQTLINELSISDYPSNFKGIQQWKYAISISIAFCLDFLICKNIEMNHFLACVNHLDLLPIFIYSLSPHAKDGFLSSIYLFNWHKFLFWCLLYHAKVNCELQRMPVAISLYIFQGCMYRLRWDTCFYHVCPQTWLNPIHTGGGGCSPPPGQ